MSSKAVISIFTTTTLALFHIIVVAVPVLSSGGSGEPQGFAAGIFDFPIVWLLDRFPAGRAVLYGSSHALYIFIFSVGGTLMYAVGGLLLGYGLHRIVRAFKHDA